MVVEAAKCSIEEQVAEMIAVCAEAPFRYGETAIRPRLERRLAILSTLKWLEENREAVIAAHKLLRTVTA